MSEDSCSVRQIGNADRGFAMTERSATITGELANREQQLEAVIAEYIRDCDAGLELLKALTNLETLNVEDTKVTDAGVADFQKALPNVKVIR